MEKTPQQQAVSNVLTAQEIDARWGLPSGVCRVYRGRGKFDLFIEQGLVRRAGKVWLFHRDAVVAVFGEEPVKGGSEE